MNQQSDKYNILQINPVDSSRSRVIGGRRPDDVFKRRPELFAAELVVLQGVAARLLHLHHQKRRRYREYVRRYP